MCGLSLGTAGEHMLLLIPASLETAFVFSRISLGSDEVEMVDDSGLFSSC